ncbi:hypothetical protein ACWEVP_46315 [Amycolatopsis sp. NPDC003865]
MIAVSFFALAAYVTVESARSLFWAEAAEHSTVGIVLAAVAVKEGREAWRGEHCC